MQAEVVLELLAYLLLAGAMTALGLFAELQSFLRLSAGETTVALWLGGVGLLLLYGGVYMLAYEKVLGTLQRARS